MERGTCMKVNCLGLHVDQLVLERAAPKPQPDSQLLPLRGRIQRPQASHRKTETLTRRTSQTLALKGTRCRP